MRVIGLTGGIASGKSTVAKILEDKGAYLLDADIIAREVVEPGQSAWEEIVDWLGESILLPDKTIDRARLAELVFNDRDKLAKLNNIVHPRVGSRFVILSENIKVNDPEAVIIYDIPLLVETGMEDIVDLVLLVYVPRGVQIDRLQRRDNLSRAEAELRLEAQMPLEEKKKFADVIIDNSGSITETASQVDSFWEQLSQG